MHLTGSIEYREYEDRDGQKKYITEIVMKFNATLTLLGDARSDDDGGDRTAPVERPRPALRDELNDEIPF